MISCFILGDPKTFKNLGAHIEKFLLTTFIGHSVVNADELAKLIDQRPQIVFVEASAIFRHKKALSALAQVSTVIYFSPTTDDAFESFEAQGFDYLVQPISYERFERSVNKFIRFSLISHMPQASILKKIEPITDSFFIKADVKGLKLIAIKCNEVLFIEAYENYVLLHLSDGRKFVCHSTMKEMEDSLPKTFFVRVHKSFIINYDKVSSIEGNMITLNQNENQKIQIGKIYRKAFFEKRSEKMIKKQKRLLLAADIYSHIAS